MALCIYIMTSSLYQIPMYINSCTCFPFFLLFNCLVRFWFVYLFLFYVLLIFCRCLFFKEVLKGCSFRWGWGQGTIGVRRRENHNQNMLSGKKKLFSMKEKNELHGLQKKKYRLKTPRNEMKYS